MGNTLSRIKPSNKGIDVKRAKNRREWKWPRKNRGGSGILSLSDDILAQILNDCRPHDFEPFMMTCKTVYSAGLHLAKDHKFCKDWVSNLPPHLKNPKAFDGKRQCLRTSYPTECFERLMDEPAYLRRFIPAYITAISLESPWMTWRETHSLLRKLKREIPWVWEDLLVLLQPMPELLRQFRSTGPLRSFLRDELDDSLTREEIDMKDLNFLLETLILLLVSNLEHVYSDAKFVRETPPRAIYMLPQLVDGSRWKDQFQQLKSLHIGHGGAMNLDTLVKFISLPNLRLLKVIRDTGLRKESLELPSYTWGTTRSQLQQLILYSTVLSAEELAEILDHIQSLRSLILGFSISNSHPGYLFDKDYPRYPGTRHWRERKQDESIVEGDFQRDFTFEKPDWPPECRPRDQLQAVLKYQNRRNSLRHLVMSTDSIRHMPSSDPQQLILDYKDLDHLTHLETSLNLLRPSNRRTTVQGMSSYLPRPLEEILPPSVEVVRLLVANPDYRVFDSLFQGVAKYQKNIPRLRKVQLRLPIDYKRIMHIPADSGKETIYYTSFNKWRRPLQKVGVSLVIEEVYGSPYESVEIWDD